MHLAFFFSEHISTTHNEGWLRCSLWRKRGGKGWIGYLADKVLLSMPPRGKGIYLDVEEKESKAFRRFSGELEADFYSRVNLESENYILYEVLTLRLWSNEDDKFIINVCLLFSSFLFFLSFFSIMIFFFWFLGEIKETEDVFFHLTSNHGDSQFRVKRATLSLPRLKTRPYHVQCCSLRKLQWNHPSLQLHPLPSSLFLLSLFPSLYTRGLLPRERTNVLETFKW